MEDMVVGIVFFIVWVIVKGFVGVRRGEKLVNFRYGREGKVDFEIGRNGMIFLEVG